jgi:hypothetical protein
LGVSLFLHLHYVNTTETIRRTAYNKLVGELREKVDGTRSDVQRIVDKISSRSESTPEADITSIPSSPRWEDFLDVAYWRLETWLAVQHPKRGGTPDKGEDPVNCLFWEDASGNILPPTKRKAVTQDMRMYWQKLHNDGVILDNFTNIGMDICENFRTFMEGKHPWLRLCDNHWKADRLWINHFSGWQPAPGPTGRPQGNAEPANLKRERSIEEVEVWPSSKKSMLSRRGIFYILQDIL